MKNFFATLSIMVIVALLFGAVINKGVAFADQNTENTVFKACASGEGTLGAAGNPVCKNVSANKDFELIGPTGIITKIVQIIVWLVGIVSVLMIMLGGFRYVVSGGDAAGINGAKNSILYACVGLAIAIFAQVIVSFVLSNL